ncbi:MAG: DUF4230 domain-containing protein, partial [Aggregatilineales bacterium]
VVSPPAPVQAVLSQIYEPDSESGGCGKGCLYGLGGAAGCMLLVIGIFGAVFFGLTSAAGQSFDSVFNEFTSFLRIFTPAGSRNYDDLVLPIVDDLELLSELVTTRRNYVDIAISEIEMPDLLKAVYGDSAVLVVVGSVEAGIDLSQMSADDIQFNTETGNLTVELPAPQIRACFLDESQTRVVERNTGIFAQPARDVADAARQFAIRGFLERAHEDAILDDAQIEAEQSMRELLDLILGDDEDNDDLTITVQFANPDPDATLPDSCT